jgi:glyoxylase-like metal-dependent hydrolase (beta-lactamase superfamily II)
VTGRSRNITTVAEGVVRIHRAGVNCYLLTEGGLTLVDAGLPGMWPLLLQALGAVGADPDDLDAVVLTHGHFDHVGLSDRLHRRYGVRSRIHEADVPVARHPYRYDHQRPRWPYPFRHPGGVPILAAMTAAGALTVKGTDARGDVRPGEAMDVPGRPIPVLSPGHTHGHCGFFLGDRGVLLSGDALVTLDPYTGRRGPRMVARAATADVESNILSLDRFADTGARIVLPGHGEPFEAGARRAVELARREPVA